MAAAFARRVRRARLTEPTEREHVVALRFERGWATLQVQRTVHNVFERHDEAMFSVYLPKTAVATGLRTLGEEQGKPRWFVADLLEAEAAAATYTELTGLGGYYPKDPALLSWRRADELALQVFPVAPDTTKTVDYTLMMPASYVDGRWRIELSALGTPTLPATLTLDPSSPLDQLFVDGKVVPAGHELVLASDTVIELAARDPAAVELAVAAVDTGEQRELVHYRVTVAPKLSTLPERAKIVVILDLSSSRSETQIEAQRGAALAYASHFVDPALEAEVALLGFNHRVTALTPGFVGAGEAVELLEQVPLLRRNGSEIGLALAEADRLLTASGRGPRRILVLSDFETAAALTPEQSTAAVAHSKAIVHFAQVDGSGQNLERDDSHPWASLAAGTGGVQWTARIRAGSNSPIDDEQRALFEEWARPLRIDELALQCTGAAFAPDLQPQFAEPGFIDTLAEGEGLDELLISRQPLAALVVTGKLWNEPVRYVGKPSRAEGDRWAAMVFGSWLLDEFSEAEMMTLALRGGAVSPVTSYLAIEPGVRPSTEGIREWERGTASAAGGAGRSGLIWGSGSGGGSWHKDPQEWLTDELNQLWTRCGGAGVHATVELETMSMELLELDLHANGSDPVAEACTIQSAWGLELHELFVERERWTVELE